MANIVCFPICGKCKLPIVADLYCIEEEITYYYDDKPYETMTPNKPYETMTPKIYPAFCPNCGVSLDQIIIPDKLPIKFKTLKNYMEE